MKGGLELISQNGHALHDVPSGSHDRAVEAETEPLDAYSRAVVGAVEKVAPAVVNIEVHSHSKAPMADGHGPSLSLHKTASF